LKTPALPAVKNLAAARSAVDRFVMARLEKSNLAMSKEADARKLVRRIYFDLIGLPPDPEEIEKFLGACDLNARRRWRRWWMNYWRARITGTLGAALAGCGSLCGQRRAGKRRGSAYGLSLSRFCDPQFE